MIRFTGLTRTAVAACATAAFAAGCSGGATTGGSTFAPAASSQRLSAATYRPMVDARGVMSQWP
ncbi:MAG TPA: hypothetical protein VGF18_02420, partial [Candidatus Tumulicola sp.]